MQRASTTDELVVPRVLTDGLASRLLFEEFFRLF
jgi:hypothetical protein